MDCEKDVETYEDQECCCVLAYKLRKQRHRIVISFLLVAVIVSIAIGLYNGIIFKEYSSLTMVVGIFFPSITLMFTCVYIACIYRKKPFSSTILSRNPYLTRESHQHGYQIASQRPQMNTKTGVNLRVRYQPTLDVEALNGLVKAKSEEGIHSKIIDMTNDSFGYGDTKIRRNPFRSFSSSDISRQVINSRTLSRKSKIRESNCKRASDCQYSSRLRRHPYVPKIESFRNPREFKRCAGYIANKLRDTKPSGDMSFSNIEARENFRRYSERKYSMKDGREQRNREYSYRTDKTQAAQISYPAAYYCRSNRDLEKFKKETCCRDSMKKHTNEIGKYKNKQYDYSDIPSPKTPRKKYSLSKSEIPLIRSSSMANKDLRRELPQTSLMTEHHYVYRKPLDLHKISERGLFVRDDEQNDIHLRSNTAGKLEKYIERSKCLPPDQETEYLKRKAIYSPSLGNDSADLAHAVNYCRYFQRDSKMTDGAPLKKTLHMTNRQ